MSNNIYKVTKLEKRGKKYIVHYNDEEYKFTEDIIVKYSLLQGYEFTENKFAEIKKAALQNELLNKVLNYLGYSVRSEKEVYLYLKKKEATNTDIALIIEQLKKYNYIDDEKTAKAIFSYYTPKKGPKYIASKLYDKGINKDIIENVISMYTEDIQKANIMLIINSVADKYIQYPVMIQKKKLYSKLVSSGFSYTVIQEVINMIELREDSDEKLVSDYNKLLKKYETYLPKDKKSKIITSLLKKGYKYEKIKNILTN
ncbi:MAG: RecX family transcriptional regulator [Bacilli bacterium]